jgi:uncharacterized repeat protein (TIGR01451 family)
MKIKLLFRSMQKAVLPLLLAAVAAAQEPAKEPVPPLQVTAVAEIESKSTEAGREVVKLIPADRVVPGDRVIYTLEVHNTGATAVDAPIVIHPVPEHMLYVADTAVGPAAEVSYSVDGCRSFDRAENLKMLGTDGLPRLAIAADYTHIRWQLRNSLKANSTAFVRFRAVVK